MFPVKRPLSRATLRCMDSEDPWLRETMREHFAAHGHQLADEFDAIVRAVRACADDSDADLAWRSPSARLAAERAEEILRSLERIRESIWLEVP